MELPMRVALGQFNRLDDEERLLFIKQLGVDDIILNTPALPGETHWEFSDLLAWRTKAEEAGLRLGSIENVPIWKGKGAKRQNAFYRIYRGVGFQPDTLLTRKPPLRKWEVGVRKSEVRKKFFPSDFRLSPSDFRRGVIPNSEFRIPNSVHSFSFFTLNVVES